MGCGMLVATVSLNLNGARLAMHANDIKFSVAPAQGGKQLVGNFYGVFDYDCERAYNRPLEWV